MAYLDLYKLRLNFITESVKLLTLSPLHDISFPGNADTLKSAILDLLFKFYWLFGRARELKIQNALLIRIKLF